MHSTVAKPKVSYKQLYWRKQRLNPKFADKYGSVWKELKKIDPPKEQLTHLFGTVKKEAEVKEVRTTPTN